MTESQQGRSEVGEVIDNDSLSTKVAMSWNSVYGYDDTGVLLTVQMLCL